MESNTVWDVEEALLGSVRSQVFWMFRARVGQGRAGAGQLEQGRVGHAGFRLSQASSGRGKTGQDGPGRTKTVLDIYTISKSGVWTDERWGPRY